MYNISTLQSIIQVFFLFTRLVAEQPFLLNQKLYYSNYYKPIGHNYVIGEQAGYPLLHTLKLKYRRSVFLKQLYVFIYYHKNGISFSKNSIRNILYYISYILIVDGLFAINIISININHLQFVCFINVNLCDFITALKLLSWTLLEGKSPFVCFCRYTQ